MLLWIQLIMLWAATWDLFFVAHICLVFGKLALGKVQEDVNISVSINGDAKQEQRAGSSFLRTKAY